MIIRHPQFLILLVLLPALAWAWRARGGRTSPAALGLRLLIVALIVAAIADPVLGGAPRAEGALVVLVDQSDSLGAAGQAALADQAAALARAHRGPAHVIRFGANEVAADDPAGPRADQTDIAGALATARGLLGGATGRVVLLSDGAATRGDALAAARALGQPVDTLAYAPAARPEIWVARVEAPQTLRSQEEFSVTVVVGSSAAASAQLDLSESGRSLASQAVELRAGENRFSYQERAGDPGIARFEANVAGQPDTFAQNNRGAATALIAPQPRVLLVESRAGTAGPIGRALRGAGVQADITLAARLPAQISALDGYEGVVLVDVPAGDMTLDQMATLREYVRGEGRGLVATGGRSSFTLGAYKGTPLEELLPVRMDPPPRPERPPVALLLIVDHSLSMGGAGAVSKFDMAKEAALLATESLRQEDRIGVLAFDESQLWVVDFQILGSGLSLGQIQQRIGELAIGGGTDICAALDIGLSALERQPGQVRHAVIMTDGQSFRNDRCGPYEALLERARADDISLSSIAIGADADTELLQNLARWGAGRYHFAADPADIPRLTLIESQIASAEPEIEGDFRAQLQAPHPLLRDFTPNQIPKLTGYVGTALKPGAELVLKSPQDDPVLAAWQYGLGRAVAWTPSADAPWAEAWPNWPDYGKFWAQIVRYTLPEPDSGPLRVRATARADAVEIAVDALTPAGQPIDLADTVATITLPDGSARELPLRQTAPGHYVEDVALPRDGAYAIAVTQRKDGLAREAAAGYVQRPSAEYTPASGGGELLAQISAATGGSVLDSLAARDTPAGAAAAPRELWPWLLAAAALLWPIEIAQRRGWLRWRR